MYNCCIYFFLLIIMLSAAGPSNAQKNPGKDNYSEKTPPEKYYFSGNMRVSESTGIPAAVYQLDYPVKKSSPEEMARQFLSENSPGLKLKKDLSDIVFKTSRETKAGYRIHFYQVFDGIPVYNSDIVVSINKKNRVVFLSSGYKKINESKSSLLNKPINIDGTEALSIARDYLRVTGKINFEESRKVVVSENGRSRLAHKVNLVPSEGNLGDWEILVDGFTGEIIRSENKACFLKSSDDEEQVSGSAWVFDPDPVTHSRNIYGAAGFTDNDDEDSDSLNSCAEKISLNDIKYSRSSGKYLLKSSFAEIRDFEAPFTGLHTSHSKNFHFTRNDDSFEAVNIFYHINKSMHYVNEILSFELMPYHYDGGVRFDPHGLNGLDNSYYLPSTGQLSYGDGGVDDGEDLSVILHELGHGIHDWITEGGLSQHDGLSEGCGDYWAASYLRSTDYWSSSDGQYNWVFLWDGHNQFWDGRITNYSASYPDGLINNIHIDGQIWSSALLSIYDQIGRNATDLNFLEALSMIGSGSNQVDAAYAFLQADKDLFDGEHLQVISREFISRGYFISPVSADFFAEATGGPPPLKIKFKDQTRSILGDIISWEWDFNSDGLIDSDKREPVWTFNEPGIYSVTLTVSDGTNRDAITRKDYISVNRNIFVWEGIPGGKDYSGSFIKNFLVEQGYPVNYSSQPDLPTSLEGYDAVFLSYGNYGSDGTSNTEFKKSDATVVLDYLKKGGAIYIEGGDVLGFDQKTNKALLKQLGIESVSDGSFGPTIITDLKGRQGSLMSSMQFFSSTQENNNYIDLYDPGSGGKAAFTLGGYGNVAVQNSSKESRTFCFSYALSGLADAQSPATKNEFLKRLLNFFEIATTPVELISFTADAQKDKINLRWETVTEKNNLGFDIERMQDMNGTWEKIGFVPGHGTTAEKQYYSFYDDHPRGKKLSYRLKQVDYDGTYSYSQSLEIDAPLPVQFALLQNYPNPFNPSTTISCRIPEDSFVRLTIYDILGNEVNNLVNEEKKAGVYDFVFNAKGLSSGVYYYKLKANNFVQIKKMVLLR